MSRVPLLVSCAVLAVSVAACGDGGGGGSQAAGDEPVTQRALAAIAADVLGDPDSAGPWSNTSAVEADGVAASIDLGDDAVTVIVGRGIADDGPTTDCDDPDDNDDGCEERDDVTVSWQEEEPEEDPGIVVVHADRPDGGDVVVYYYPSVSISDPRRQDLPVPLDDLVALAKDPRVDLTTTQDAVDAGEALEVWKDE